MGLVTPIDINIKNKILDKIKDEGLPVSKVATEYGVNPRTIYGWLKNSLTNTNGSLVLELNKVKKENEQLYNLLGRATVELKRSKK